MACSIAWNGAENSPSAVVNLSDPVGVNIENVLPVSKQLPYFLDDSRRA
jgi:hypothetical protein